MAYNITYTNGTLFASLGDGIVDTRTGLSLIGRNYHNYGELIANNFLHLLENQANDTQPTSPVEGQLWWDTSLKVLNFFDGDRFKPCSSSAIGIDAPIAPLEGDQWWDKGNNQLKIHDGSQWLVIGPAYSSGQGATGVTISTVTDANSYLHTIALLQVNGNTVATISNDSIFAASQPISGITNVSPGITLAPNAIFSGSTTNSYSLGGIDAANYARKDADNVLQGKLTITNVNGLTVGNFGNTSLTGDGFGNQRILATGGNLSLLAGASTVTLDSVTGEVSVSTFPATQYGVATKGYVDSTVLNSNTAMTTYVNTSIGNVIAGAQLPTLNALSTAIGNDPSFYINTDAKLSFKANLASPQFTGYPTVANSPTTPSGIATKQYIDGEINSLQTAIANPITIGTTSILLGSNTTTLTGLTSVNSASVTATHLTGAVVTPSQPNITSLGTLTSLTVAGYANFANTVAPTAEPGTNTTQLATTAFVTNAINTVAAEMSAEIQDATEQANLSLVSLIGYFPLSFAPPGWLKANGAAVSRTTYAALFALLGTTHGAGNGTTTFNLPDYRGEFFRAWDDGRGIDAGRALNSSQTDEFKSHIHQSQYDGRTPGSIDYIGGGSEIGGMGSSYNYPTTATGGTETRPRNMALLACIKY